MFRVFEAERVDDKGIVVVKEGKKQFSFNDSHIQGVIEYPDGGCCLSIHMMMFLVPYTPKEVAAWLNDDTTETLDEFCSKPITYNK